MGAHKARPIRNASLSETPERFVIVDIETSDGRISQFRLDRLHRTELQRVGKLVTLRYNASGRITRPERHAGNPDIIRYVRNVLIDAVDNGRWSSEPFSDVPESTPRAPRQAETNVEDVRTIVSEMLRSEGPEMVRSVADDILSSSTPLNMTAIRQAVQERVEDIINAHRVVVVRPDEPEVTLDGTLHHMFRDVLAVLMAGDNALMVGPMGTGKTTLAAQVADAMGLQFRALSVAGQLPMSAIFGYMNATGAYVRTAFREIWEHGGVFLWDEFDAAHPNTMVSINMALANGHCEFPDARVAKHENTRMLAAANTFGTGADRTYVGRNQLDAATLDRFCVVPIPIDETVETAVAMAAGAPEDKVRDLLTFVRALRRNAESAKLPLVFSPRATEFGAKLLAQGLPIEKVIAYRIRKGISDTDWLRVTAGVRVPS